MVNLMEVVKNELVAGNICMPKIIMELAWDIKPPSKEITEQEQIENQQIQMLNSQIASIMGKSSKAGGNRRRRTVKQARKL